MRKFLHTKKGILIILLVLILGIGVYFSIKKVGQYLYIQEVEQKNSETMKAVQQPSKPVTSIPADTSTKTFQDENSSISTTQSLGENSASQIQNSSTSAYIEVPFITQAPLETTKNWELHENSCEEAAVLQAYLYESGKTMTKEEANTEILKMIDWEIKNLGGHNDLYADGVRGFINGYYSVPLDKIEVVYDAGLDDIKKFIDQKHPVIVPIMGDILKNPYYPYPGYHMLVVTGYTKDRIITNDNGTRRGKDFTYDNETFLKAMRAAGGDIVVIKTKTTSS